MDKNRNSFVFMFAAAVCVVCSLFVSGAATILKERQQKNVRIDIQKNILAALSLIDPETAQPEEVAEAYRRSIKPFLVERNGAKTEGKVPDKVDCDALFADGSEEQLPVYASLKNGRIDGYAIPICGKGLWSTLYGYFALEADGNRVKGITFYKHGETPGLGGEVEKEWFQENFVGKSIADDQGKLVSITVIKGKVSETVTEEKRFCHVDGISGATITSRGVTTFLRRALESYEPFLALLRSGTEH